MDGIGPATPYLDTARTLAPTPSTTGDVADAAKRFEALLSTMLVKEMRRSLSEGFFGEGAEGDVYGGWLDQHVGQTLADRGALHVEGALRESLERKQKAAEAAP